MLRRHRLHIVLRYIGKLTRAMQRHGLNRSRYRGEAGMNRWVGLGVIADNLVNISLAMARQPGP